MAGHLTPPASGASTATTPTGSSSGGGGGGGSLSPPAGLTLPLPAHAAAFSSYTPGPAPHHTQSSHNSNNNNRLHSYHSSIHTYPATVPASSGAASAQAITAALAAAAAAAAGDTKTPALGRSTSGQTGGNGTSSPTARAAHGAQPLGAPAPYALDQKHQHPHQLQQPPVAVHQAMHMQMLAQLQAQHAHQALARAQQHAAASGPAAASGATTTTKPYMSAAALAAMAAAASNSDEPWRHGAGVAPTRLSRSASVHTYSAAQGAAALAAAGYTNLQSPPSGSSAGSGSDAPHSPALERTSTAPLRPAPTRPALLDPVAMPISAVLNGNAVLVAPFLKSSNTRGSNPSSNPSSPPKSPPKSPPQSPPKSPRVIGSGGSAGAAAADGLAGSSSGNSTLNASAGVAANAALLMAEQGIPQQRSALDTARPIIGAGLTGGDPGISAPQHVGHPINVQRVLHVEWDEKLQAFTGVPDVWKEHMPQSRTFVDSQRLESHVTPRLVHPGGDATLASGGGNALQRANLLAGKSNAGKGGDKKAATVKGHPHHGSGGSGGGGGGAKKGGSLPKNFNLRNELNAQTSADGGGVSGGGGHGGGGGGGRSSPGVMSAVSSAVSQVPATKRISVAQFLHSLGFPDLDRAYHPAALREMLLVRLSLSQGGSALVRLPYVLKLKVLALLDARSLVHSCSTCSELLQLLDNRTLWKPLVYLKNATQRTLFAEFDDSLQHGDWRRTYATMARLDTDPRSFDYLWNVVVIGDRRVGKSRLVHQLAESVRQGQGQAAHQQLPTAPVALPAPAAPAANNAAGGGAAAAGAAAAAAAPPAPAGLAPSPAAVAVAAAGMAAANDDPVVDPVTGIYRLGIDFVTRRVVIDHTVVKLQVWDGTALGVAIPYKSAHVVMIVYDVCNKASFDRVSPQVTDVRARLKAVNANASILLFGNLTQFAIAPRRPPGGPAGAAPAAAAGAGAAAGPQVAGVGAAAGAGAGAPAAAMPAAAAGLGGNSERVVPFETAKRFANERGLVYVEANVADTKSVDDAFATLTTELMTFAVNELRRDGGRGGPAGAAAQQQSGAHLRKGAKTRERDACVVS